jgi:hypothetical protein
LTQSLGISVHRTGSALTTAIVALALLAAAPLALAGALIDFATDQGNARMARASARADFAALSNQFEGQPNDVFCGPTSAAIVLNALYGLQSALPGDRSRRGSQDSPNRRDGADLNLPRFTPDSVIEKGKKTRAQVFGEPMRLGDRTIRDFGYQLHQLAELLEGNGAVVKKVVVSDALSDDIIRAELIRNMQTGGDYVIVNYLRKAVGQAGGGHISPLAAYDAASDSFLVLDVNPAAAGWVWMPAGTLIAGMRTFDRIENRGYILVALQGRPSSRPQQ